MDPVMGDNGKLYVNEDVIPAYKSLLPYAGLILPNQFEAEYGHPSAASLEQAYMPSKFCYC